MKKLIFFLLLTFSASLIYAGAKEKKLIQYAYANDYNKVKRMVFQGANVNQLQRSNNFIYAGMTALYWAVKHNNYRMTKFLLLKRAKTSYRDRYRSFTPTGKHIIHPLINCRNIRILKLFVNRRAKIDIMDGDSQGFINLLAANRKYYMIKYLLKKNPNLAKKRYGKAFGVTALMASKSVRISKLLLRYGAPINAQHRISGKRALDFALKLQGGKSLGYSNPNWSLADLLIKKGSKVTPINKRILRQKRRPYQYKHKNYFYFKKRSRIKELLKVVKQGHVQATKQLLKYIKNVNVSNSFGESALRLAVRAGHLKIIKMLIDKGANITKREKDAINKPMNPGRWSLYKRDKQAIAKLLNNTKNSTKFDFNTTNNRNREETLNQFVQYARQGNLSQIKKYVKIYRVPVNASNRSGRFAIIEAASKGKVNVVTYLLSQGATISAKEANKYLRYACYKNNLALVKVLLGAGAGLDTAQTDGQTALFFAARGGRLAIVKFLITNGANKRKKDKRGKTAFDAARSRRKYKVLRYLRTTRSYPKKSPIYFKNKYAIKVRKSASKRTHYASKNKVVNKKLAPVYKSRVDYSKKATNGYLKIIYSNGKASQVMTKRQMVFMGGRFRTNALTRKNTYKAKKLSNNILFVYPKGLLAKYFSFLYFAQNLRGNETSINGAKVIRPLKMKPFLAINVTNRQAYDGAHYAIARAIAKKNLKKKMHWTPLGYRDRKLLRKAKFDKLKRMGYLTKRAVTSVNADVADYIKMLFTNPRRLKRLTELFPKVRTKTKQVYKLLREGNFLLRKYRVFE